MSVWPKRCWNARNSRCLIGGWDVGRSDPHKVLYKYTAFLRNSIKDRGGIMIPRYGACCERYDDEVQRFLQHYAEADTGVVCAIEADEVLPL